MLTILRRWLHATGWVDVEAARRARRRIQRRWAQAVPERFAQFEPLEERRVLSVQMDLVADLNQSALSSSPNHLTVVGDDVYFLATKPGDSLPTLWKSDLTSSGTFQVPALDAALPEAGIRPAGPFANVAGSLFFGVGAYEGEDPFRHYGLQIWKTDGTRSGAEKLGFISQVVGGISDYRAIYAATAVGDTLYLIVGYNNRNRELWKIADDGQGAARLADVNVSPTGGTPQEPGQLNLWNVGGHLYFTAYMSDSSGGQLWTSDGTPSGTIRIADIPSFDYQLTDVNGTLFFRGRDAEHGNELWKTDGAASGTVLVEDLVPGPQSGGLSGLANLNGQLFFTTDAQGRTLWKTDGAAKTRIASLPSRIVRENDVFISVYPRQFVVAGHTVYFIDLIEDPEISTVYGLWGIDADAPGQPQLLKGNLSAPRPSFSKFTNVASVLYFTATDGIGNVNESQLWRSDGTPSGTVQVSQFVTEAPQHYSRFELTNVNGTLVFAADDQSVGNELWKIASATGQVELVRDLAVGTRSLLIEQITTVGDDVFFVHNDGYYQNHSLWKSDGTCSGTALVFDAFRPQGFRQGRLRELTAVGGSLFFSALDAEGSYRLWKSDGTSSGTVRVQGVESDPYLGRNPYDLINVQGLLFFSASVNSARSGLWRSDGASTGTYLVLDDLTSNVQEMTAVGSKLYFKLRDYDLWQSDGTSQGTFQIQEFLSPLSEVRELTDVGGRLFFNTRGPTGGQLWRTDDSPAGVQPIPNANGYSLTNVNGELYFIRSNRAQESLGFDVEIWKTDGTSSGTQLVFRTPFPATPYGAVNANGTLYFSIRQELIDQFPESQQVWKSDGASTGTTRVLAAGNEFNAMLPASGGLVVQPPGGPYVNQLWLVKPELAEPKLLATPTIDISQTSLPSWAAAGESLFFPADDITHGVELWKATRVFPTASAGGPYEITVGSGLRLDATGSTDATGAALREYSWDINGDGVFGDATGPQPALTWQQLTALGIQGGAGPYNVRVRVADSTYDRSDSPAVSLQVARLPAAIVTVQNSPQALTFGSIGYPEPALALPLGVLAISTAVDPATETSYIGGVLDGGGVIYRIDADGFFSTLADASAGLAGPVGLAVDATGNVLVADAPSQQVFRISPTGVATRLAGAEQGLTQPMDVTVSPQTGDVFIADMASQRVLALDLQGNVRVFADASDGLFSPTDLAVDPQGNVLVADVLRSMVFKFSPTGAGEVFADVSDGILAPSGLDLDDAGNVYVANFAASTIVKLSPAGSPTLMAERDHGIEHPVDLMIRNDQSVANAGSASLRAEAAPPTAELQTAELPVVEPAQAFLGSADSGATSVAATAVSSPELGAALGTATTVAKDKVLSEALSWLVLRIANDVDDDEL